MIMDFPSRGFTSPQELLLTHSIYHKQLYELRFHFLTRTDHSSPELVRGLLCSWRASSHSWVFVLLRCIALVTGAPLL